MGAESARGTVRGNESDLRGGPEGRGEAGKRIGSSLGCVVRLGMRAISKAS